MSRSTAPAYDVPHLRAWRNSRFLSQAQLAKDADVSVATIKYLESLTAEKRHPASAATVAKLAKALGISPDVLLSTEPEIEKAPAVVTSGRTRRRGDPKASPAIV